MPGPGSSASPKPAKGTARLARIAKRLELKARERDVKDNVRKRDGIGCRWPNCKYWRLGIRVEAAHYEDAGMGGDPTGARMTEANLIRLCFIHHQGEKSIHSKDRRIDPMSDKGMGGPCAFYVKADGGRWIVVGVEQEPGVLI